MPARLNRQIRGPTLAFRRGLADLLNPEWLALFDATELQMLVSGVDSPIDLADLRRHLRYGGAYHDTHPVVARFWRVLETVAEADRTALVKVRRAACVSFCFVFFSLRFFFTPAPWRADRARQFVTSCPRPPLMGFANLHPPFCVCPSGEDLDRLPTSATCMNLVRGIVGPLGDGVD